MRERLFVDAEMAAEIERRAAAAGIPVEAMGARLLAKGALATLADLLAPLLLEDDAERPRLTTGADSHNVTAPSVVRSVPDDPDHGVPGGPPG